MILLILEDGALYKAEMTSKVTAARLAAWHKV